MRARAESLRLWEQAHTDHPSSTNAHVTASLQLEPLGLVLTPERRALSTGCYAADAPGCAHVPGRRAAAYTPVAVVGAQRTLSRGGTARCMHGRATSVA